MSALLPIATEKADICSARANVRYGPIADIHHGLWVILDFAQEQIQCFLTGTISFGYGAEGDLRLFDRALPVGAINLPFPGVWRPIPFFHDDRKIWMEHRNGSNPTRLRNDASAVEEAMSAKGQKQTCAVQGLISSRKVGDLGVHR